MAVVNDDELVIGIFGNEMPGEALQAGSEVDVKFVNAREVGELFYRGWDVCGDGGGKATRETCGTPDVLDELAAFEEGVFLGVDGDGAIVGEFGGVGRKGEKANRGEEEANGFHE